jgi:hypothetical protein
MPRTRWIPVVAGRKYGRLTIMGEVGRSKGHWLIKLKCDCGKVIVARKDRVLHGNTKSCGCLQREVASKNSHHKSLGESSFNYLYRRYLKKAHKRGYAFELGKDVFKSLTGQPCHYCGKPPSTRVNRPGSYGDYIYNGLDRIDSSRGYTLDNVVPACFTCNQRKSDASMAEFKEWVSRVYHRLYS